MVIESALIWIYIKLHHRYYAMIVLWNVSDFSMCRFNFCLFFVIFFGKFQLCKYMILSKLTADFAGCSQQW